MKNSTFVNNGTPPRLLSTLIKGFNTIANHWYLILFPILLDLALWLGPKFRVKSLLSNVYSMMSDYMLSAGTPEMADTVKAFRPVWEQILNQLNLATVIRTFPVGIPSLIARESPIISPLGENLIYEITSVRWVIALIGLFLLAGFLLGSLYFILIAKVTSQDDEKLHFKEVVTGYAQSLTLFCLLVIILVLISIPLSLLLSVLTLIDFSIGQFFIILVLFATLWLLMPLVFAPHGIFVLKQKALPSMLISVRLVRLFLPGTGLFVVTSLIINEGLNMLWTLPEADSWMTLLGIGGHSFIITGLLAASFIYYREGLRWMQENLQRMAEATKKQQENGGTTLEQ